LHLLSFLLAYCPARHEVQEELFRWETFPTPQVLHASHFSAEYFPGGQLLHDKCLYAYCPAGQGKQDFFPASDHVPTGHCLQTPGLQR
jgi:hypothetical protein